MKMINRAVLRAALVLMLASAVLAAPSSPKPTSKPRPPAKPKPCRWYPSVKNAAGLEISPGSCGPNRAFTATLLSKEGKTGSTLTRINIGAAAAGITCEKYNTTTPAGKAACNADRANRCFVSADGSVCGSNMESYRLANELFCKDSPYQQAALCRSLFKEECQKQPFCVYSEDYWFQGAMSEEARANFYKQMGGPPPLACVHETEIEAAWNGTTVDPAAKKRWEDTWRDGNPTNKTNFFERRGTCSFATRFLARELYTRSCRDLNTMATKFGFFINMTDIETKTKCREIGCDVRWSTGIYNINRGLDFPPEISWCAAQQDYVIRTLTLDAKKDGRYLAQQLMCTNIALTYEDRCLDVVV